MQKVQCIAKGAHLGLRQETKEQKIAKPVLPVHLVLLWRQARRIQRCHIVQHATLVCMQLIMVLPPALIVLRVKLVTLKEPVLVPNVWPGIMHLLYELITSMPATNVFQEHTVQKQDKVPAKSVQKVGR